MTLTLYPITKQDAPIFMTLRNGSDTYHWFYSNRQFTLQEVENWIAHLNPVTDLVFMVEQDNQVVGTCSIYNILNNSAEVGRIVVAENIRGKGIGCLILLQIIQIAISKGLFLLYANIKTDNISSQRAFEKAGFIRVEEKETGYYYELSLRDNDG